jgi:DNA-binding MarR family transcriptional regulator
MEGMQLLTRVQSNTDQRKVIIHLTGQSSKMQAKAAGIPLKLLNRLNIADNEAELSRMMELKNQLYNLIHLLERSEQTTK